MYCIKCGKKIENGTEICPQCGEMLATQNHIIKHEWIEKVKSWPCFLSVLIPIVGLIFFIIWQNKKPRQAKLCGICALVFYAPISLLNFVNVSAELIPRINAEFISDIRSALIQKNSAKPIYNDSKDGVLSFTQYGKNKNICYDALTDSIIVWNSNCVHVYRRSDGTQLYSYDYTTDVSTVSAYNGVLCVGFGGDERKILVIDLHTGVIRTVKTRIEIDDMAVTDGMVAFCDEDQLDIVDLTGNIYTTSYLRLGVSKPKLAINHDEKLLYVSECNSSFGALMYIDMRTLEYGWIHTGGERDMESVYFDGEYVHAYGNTYDAFMGIKIADCGYAETVNSDSLRLKNTLCRNDNISFITAYNKKTAIFDNKKNEAIYILDFDATKIYYVEGDLYIAICGDSGYVGLIDLSKIKRRPDNPTPDTYFPPVYIDAGDGVSLLTDYGRAKNTCYDALTDSIIVWNTRHVCVYRRADGVQLYSYDYTINIGRMCAYNGVLYIGFKGYAKQIELIDLHTGKCKTVNTEIEVVEIAVTDGMIVFCDGAQRSQIGIIDLFDYTVKYLHLDISYPKMTINHVEKLLYIAELGTSGCNLMYIDLKSFEIKTKTNGSHHDGKGVHFDGEYVHAFGNTFDAINGIKVAYYGYAEDVNLDGFILTYTICRDGDISFIGEKSNRTVVFNNKKNEIICVLNLAATEIYHVEGDLYVALCGDSGYVGFIDLSKYKK